MVFGKNSFWYKLLALFLVLALMVPLLAACDDDDEDEDTATTPAETAPATAVSGETAAPTSDDPVKIGALCAWSGDYGMAGILADHAIDVVSAQVEARGGINVGGVMRPMEIVKCDDESLVPGTITCVTKLALQEKVSAMVFGGVHSASHIAAMDRVEEMGIPNFSLGSAPDDLEIAEATYTIRAVYPSHRVVGQLSIDYILKNLKPETVGFLLEENEQYRVRVKEWEQQFEDAGVEVVYSKLYTAGTKDFSSMLTAVRQKGPDVLIASGGAQEFFMNVFKQIAAVGGWNDTIFFSMSGASSTALADMPEASVEGTYHYVLWEPGVSTPAAVEMEQAFIDATGRPPIINHIYFYYCLWTAIHAIELAGSDNPDDIAAAARSGNLVWEAPSGTVTIQTTGVHDITGLLLKYEGGEFVIAPEIEE